MKISARTRTPIYVILAMIAGALVTTGSIAAVDRLPEYMSESGMPTHWEMDLAHDWTSETSGPDCAKAPWSRMLEGWVSTRLPFRFSYAGKDSDSLLGEWKYTRTGGSRRDMVTMTDPETGLRLTWQIRRFSDYPAVEWVLTFENTGNKDTPIIEDVQALRLGLSHSAKGQGYAVQGANGGRCGLDDYMPVTWQSRADTYSDVFELGGSYSSNVHLPFFSVETPEGRGVLVGVGWTGTWLARMRTRGSEMVVEAGMRDEHLYLKPGEKVRTPRMLLVFWEGKKLHGHNMLRQVLHKYYVRPVSGKPQKPLVSVNFCFTHGSGGGFLSRANEKTIAPLVQPFLSLGAEAMVIDAGWYECEDDPSEQSWMQISGHPVFEYSKKRYPNGFRPISEVLKKAGVYFGLWFVPELVGHMGGADERRTLLGYVDTLAKNELLTMYRQDSAHTTRGDHDANRLGIDEIDRMQCLYLLWDEIIKRHPEMLMEGCSSGGRRIDLETMLRFSWSQKSDNFFNTESDQCGLYGSSLFLPGGVINVPTRATDDYGTWSSFAGQLCLAWHPIDPSFPMEQAKQQVERYKRVRHLLSGDFYPLTVCSLDGPWLAYQFHRIDLDEGFALVFRRPSTQENKIILTLKGLNPKSRYNVHFEHTGKDLTLSGSEVSKAMDVLVDQMPGAEMIVYRKAKRG